MSTVIPTVTPGCREGALDRVERLLSRYQPSDAEYARTLKALAACNLLLHQLVSSRYCADACRREHDAAASEVRNAIAAARAEGGRLDRRRARQQAGREQRRAERCAS